jgi:hypothetical protein
MTLPVLCHADTRTPAEREHAERMHNNLRAVTARQGGSLLNEDELRESRRMTERIDALIHSRSERQRERAFRLMDRQDAIVSRAWHRAAALG